MPALATQARQSIPVVRDAETESLMRDYLRPILRAAGLGSSRIDVVLVQDDDFNAFVADGRRIFVNTGTILKSGTPNELIGVLAHETGHLAGNHLAQLRDQMRKAQIMSALAILLGAGGMAAAGASGIDAGQAGQGAQAMILGANSMIDRSLRSYIRSQEATADRAALTYLERTHQSAKGMIETFRRLADEQLFSSRYADPYARTHPMAAQRIAQIEALARKSPYFNRKDPPALQLRHELVRAKLAAFTGQPQHVGRLYPPSDTSLPARYARAIIAYRFGALASAIQQIDGLIREQPNNPYFWELKGQALFEGGHPREAIEPLARAVSLAPKEGLIRILYGSALEESGDASRLDTAIRELKRALNEEPDASDGWRYLSIALARRGSPAEADVAAAQEAFARGDYDTAKGLAARAKRGLKTGSPAWLQADDILKYRPPVSLRP